ncbi:hypothetical protein SDC9_190715 [bioreactor metagenome]|uniref:Uncharacterized protein n=1 Tax=bioreactor metagenome TaxID=1076179 RepID=A0A645HX44_9ZZZZ
MLIVAPNGSVKLQIDLGTPKFSSVLFILIGRVAELDAVVYANIIAGAIPLKNCKGVTFASPQTVNE